MFGIAPAYADTSSEQGVDPLITLLHDPLALTLYAVFILIIPIIVTSITTIAINRIEHSRGYEKNRSEYITHKRFDREIAGIQDLSENLLILIQITKSLIRSPVYSSKDEWLNQRKKVIALIGKSAPFLNYLDLSNGSVPYCGVSKKHLMKEENKEGDSQENTQNIKEAKRCVCREDFNESISLRDSQLSSPDSLYRDINSEKVTYGKNLYHRACEILMLCEISQRMNTLACIRKDKDDCYGNSSSPHEYQTYLDCRYERFINCAYCRLNMIEYGRKSLRKKNKKDRRWWRKQWKKHERHFDQKCPYIELTEGKESKHNAS